MTGGEFARNAKLIMSCSLFYSNLNYDLTSLKVLSQNHTSYVYSHDGDLDAFTYVWNICSPVTNISLPQVCLDLDDKGWHQHHAAYQYKGDSECHILGRSYEETFSLIDESNPAKGVSITYLKGSKCDVDSSVYRDSVIDIYCGNSFATITNAQELRTCSYHMVMESYYGCPTKCIVNGQGLCSSAGTCEYDSVAQTAYCKCDSGYAGESCSQTAPFDDTFYNYRYFISTSKTSSSPVLYFVGGFALCTVLFSSVLIGVVVYRRWQSRRLAGYMPIPQSGKDEDEHGIIAEIIG